MNPVSETANHRLVRQEGRAHGSLNAEVLAWGHTSPTSQMWRMSIRGRYALCGICILLSTSVAAGIIDVCATQECSKKLFAAIILSVSSIAINTVLFAGGVLNVSKFLSFEWIVNVVLLALNIAAAGVITASSKYVGSLNVERAFSWIATIIAFLNSFLTATSNGGPWETKFLPHVARSVIAARRSSQMSVAEVHYMKPVGVQPSQSETVVEPMKELPQS